MGMTSGRLYHAKSFTVTLVPIFHISKIDSLVVTLTALIFQDRTELGNWQHRFFGVLASRIQQSLNFTAGGSFPTFQGKLVSW